MGTPQDDDRQAKNQPTEQLSPSNKEATYIVPPSKGGSLLSFLRGSDIWANATLAQACRIKELVEQELEDAKAARVEAEKYREQAEEEAARAFEEVYDQLHTRAIEEMEKARTARGEAEALKAKAQQELERAEAIRAEAEGYRRRAEMEARRQAEEIGSQLRLQAEQQAERIKKEASQQVERILAEAEALKAKAQQELKRAGAIRAETGNYRQQAEKGAKCQAGEIAEQLRSLAQQQAEELRKEAIEEARGILAEVAMLREAARQQLEVQKAYSRAAEIRATIGRHLEDARAKLDETRGGLSYVQDAGERPIEGYCMKCRTKREIKHARAITMRNGRPAIQGVCPTCGTKMSRFGKG